MAKTKSKRSRILLLAAIIGIALCCYTWSYISDTSSQVMNTEATDFAEIGEQMGTMIALSAIMPHQYLATLGTFFAVLGWCMNARWSALVAGIIYSVAAALVMSWAPFVLVQMVLCYVAFAKMKKPVATE